MKNNVKLKLHCWSHLVWLVIIILPMYTILFILQSVTECVVADIQSFTPRPPTEGVFPNVQRFCGRAALSDNIAS